MQYWSQLKAGVMRSSAMRIAGSSLLLACACVVIACGSDDAKDSSSAGATTSAAAAHEGKKIAIVMPESVPGYSKQIGCGALEEGKRLGFDVGQPQAPAKSQDPTQQAAVIQSVLARNPDGLIFSAVDPEAGGIAIKPAVQKGLPVVSVDVALADPSLAISFISSSHEEGGKLGGELLAKQIGESGQVVGMGVIPSHPITRGRIGGFQEAMKAFPNIKIAAVKYPDIDVNKIAAEASALLAKYPDLKGFYTTNDTVASGVATALRQAQKIGKVKVITWDLQPVGIKLLKEGSVTGAVVQRPREEGKMAVQQLANKIDGKPVEANLSAPLTTAENTQINDPEIKALYYSNAC